MNIIIYILVFLGIIYLLLKFLANASSKKISKHFRKLIFVGSIILAIILFRWEIFTKCALNPFESGCS